MNLLRMATVLVALLAPAVARACTCAWTGPFTAVALGSDLVVLAEVRSYDRHTMDVAVIDVLEGVERRRPSTSSRFAEESPDQRRDQSPPAR